MVLNESWDLRVRGQSLIHVNEGWSYSPAAILTYENALASIVPVSSGNGHIFPYMNEEKNG